MLRQLYSDIVFYFSTLNKNILRPFNFIPKFNKIINQCLNSKHKTLLDWFLRKSNKSINKNKLISPADGKLIQAGKINNNSIIYSPNKKIKCKISQLLGISESEYKKNYSNYKSFCNIYLSPFNYHYFVSPCNLEVTNVNYIKGDLLSVDESVQNNNPNLFIKNERYIIECKSKLGKLIIIPVGAIGVSSIYLDCYKKSKNNIVNKSILFKNRTKKYTNKFVNKLFSNNSKQDQKIFKKGDHLGMFLFGSSVMMLFEKPKLNTKLIGKPVSFNSTLLP